MHKSSQNPSETNEIVETQTTNAHQDRANERRREKARKDRLAVERAKQLDVEFAELKEMCGQVIAENAKLKAENAKLVADAKIEDEEAWDEEYRHPNSGGNFGPRLTLRQVVATGNSHEYK